ncbi:nucleoside-diphosphate sugar epimerase [Lysobacter arseniciresistens ZS79]|uniref:Nucleoside-diphosphate sugar epimerase n=1 Tax=Lysobacter arseniciresistens ZS79 TaxID=913325 RepID=A0A0A0EZX5_9GAMM|nr:mitochondrial fission ELM1 family protein [Lysobacter arseniciresistens]KGM56476.1 nucleoside-diphosphate sugar epimerase [Lysobacter arseniciresistens ZS79]
MQQSSAPFLWTVTDGHAGNLRQAQALAAALGGRARNCTLQARAPWRWLAPRRLPAARHAFGSDFARALDAPPALAIGCGRQAALATRLLRARGSRAVQILDPRIAPRHWDLVIAPEHDDLQGANVIRLLGSLHPVDDDWLAAARAHFTALGTLAKPRTTLLLGGTSAHARFEPARIDALVARLLQRVDAENGCLLVTTSRRTPAEVLARLRTRLSGKSNVVLNGPGDGGNLYPGMLAWADRIVCTADSVNMLSEACATAVPVFAAGLDELRGRPRRFVDSLLGLGRLRPVDDALATFAVTPLRETARVAAEVRQRLGLDDRAARL